MKNIELQYAFEAELNNIDDIDVKLESYDIQYWLNQGYMKFVKTRYTGINARRKGFEQDQKRIEDLKRLIKTFTVDNLIATNNEYTIDCPDDCMYVLGENVYVHGKDTDPKTAIMTDVFECTIENVTRRLTNRLTDVQYHNGYARPARTFEGSTAVLTTNGEYNVSKYVMKYLKYPSKIDLFTDPMGEFSEMPNDVMHEVVKLSVQLYLASVNDARYNPVTNEVNTME